MTDTSDDIFEFPCHFPIKVMGENSPELETFVRETIEANTTNQDEIHVELRESSGGKYISITATFQADSKEQLDMLYQVLSSDKRVKMVL